MSIVKHALLTLSLAIATLLSQPILLHAFELIEFNLQVTLDSDSVFSHVFSPLLPHTGFAVSKLSEDAVTLVGTSKLDLEDPEDLISQNKQEGFVLHDRTLLLELTATDPSGGRANIRTTYRMDVAPEQLGREYLRGLLLTQGVVADEGRARARARAMDLADARIMRFMEDGNGSGTWVRAARAIRAGSSENIDIRFIPRMEPDGVLGHYGNNTDASGNAFVWAVMDHNSKYAVGFTVDRDDDGIANSDDNCVNLTNQDQSNHDTDSLGDACDPDDDNDGVPDTTDNCPLIVNADQLDSDYDGAGNACDSDADGDGLNDGIDQCLETSTGAVVNAVGCSIEDTCPCENEWKNHGAYVRCNAHTSESFVEDNLITEEEKDEIMSLAGQSACGSRK